MTSQKLCKQFEMKPCRQVTTEMISVVIPTFNEEDNIADTLTHALSVNWNEIIVSDGGSQDETLARIPEHPRIKVIHAEKGRGVQINAGVAAASSEIVAVLHADTHFPEGAVDAMKAAMSHPAVIGGCFRLRFDKCSPLLTLYAHMSRFETVLTTFGDQAYFFWRDVFFDVGGAPDWKLLEDVELRNRLRRKGRFVKLGLSVTTSSRRFDAHGDLRVQLINAILLLGYLFHVPNHVLANLQRKFAPAS